MTEEQKAKAYDETLERAKQLLRESVAFDRFTIERIFPELKESEGEQSKKWILEYLYDGLRKSDEQFKDQFTAAIAWLEKQGKQEEPQVYETEDGEIITYSETDGYKVAELKFHEGEWITNGDYTWKIVEVKPLDYILQSQDGNIVDDTIFYVDEHFHSFTIKDAKDGDILVTADSKRPFIYKGCLDPNHPNSPVAYCGIDSEGEFCRGGHKFNHWWTDENVQPATKEQCDLLIQKMKEVGYRLDADRKALKKIEPIPAWSIEDMSKVQRICVYLNEAKKYYADITEVRECIDWLKSLKQKIEE